MSPAAGGSHGFPHPCGVANPGWQETLHKLDSQPVQPGTAMPDISAILQAGAGQQQHAQSVLDRLLAESRSPAQAAATPDSIVPLVFVSFSMPDASLKQLLRDAGKIGAQLVLNGLVEDDVKTTSQRLLAIQGIDPTADKLPDGMDKAEVAGMGIDPTLFERLDIRHVPAFVLPLEPVRACAEGRVVRPFATSVSAAMSALPTRWIILCLNSIRFRNCNGKCGSGWQHCKG
ncbi:MAG: type-F conjugative transfer system pilin assembly protein TrbC [Candidatus Thiothrix singaporensis]|uniref:Type-F conjugative transfer system pilin assembly protein TrbC n=1 Tax=Candidatus Thiothrix singaporensis TaxID=2799669 RepID=A0A7L6ASG7_9GAMM|nr:MAG: type-F conjugative transfer system pilin assembly protein TrbC [Candidatus Thiothrix singaporensis]